MSQLERWRCIKQQRAFCELDELCFETFSFYGEIREMEGNTLFNFFF